MKFRSNISPISSLLLVLAGLFGSAINTAQAVTLQGSTTFNTTIIEPYGKDIEATTGIRLEVIPNKSSLGLLALFEGRADLAMISTELANEIAILRSIEPELPFDRLKPFVIGKVPAAFAVHPANPVRILPLGVIRRILTGEIINWKEIGGNDLSIRVVAVRPGGGVLATVEASLLGKDHLSAPDAIRVQVGPQVVTVVSQEPGALGITQRSVVRNAKAVELKTDQPIEQVLTLVSLDGPSDDARKVIEAVQRKLQETR